MIPVRLPFLSFLAVLVAAATLSSCTSKTTSVNGPPGTSTFGIPGAGSFFTVQNSTTDSNGILTVNDPSTDFVVKSGLSINGKTNVVLVVSSPSSDTNYLHYESNGDVSTYAPNNGFSLTASGWLTYPFGSQTTTTFTHDTVDGNGFAVHDAFTIAGSGTGIDTIKGKTFVVQKATISSTETSKGVTSTGLLIILDYAPSLGYVVKSEQPGGRDPSGFFQDAQHSIVIDYLVK